jgi:hypothetical protein
MTCWRTKGDSNWRYSSENTSLICRPNFRSCAAKWPAEKNPQKGAKIWFAPQSQGSVLGQRNGATMRFGIGLGYDQRQRNMWKPTQQEGPLVPWRQPPVAPLFAVSFALAQGENGRHSDSRIWPPGSAWVNLLTATAAGVMATTITSGAKYP